MSRTYRDSINAKLRKSRKERWDLEYYREEYVAEKYELDYSTWTRQYIGELYVRSVLLKRAGVKPKKKRSYLEHDHYWYKYTPSWYVREFMNVPKRAKCRNWEKQAVKSLDLEDLPICPDYGRKPHLYYW